MLDERTSSRKQLFQFDMFLSVDRFLFDSHSFENVGQFLHNAIFHFFRSEIVRLRKKLLDQFREGHVMPLGEKSANFLFGDRVTKLTQEDRSMQQR